jgi:nicotinamidase-related amidase
MFLPSNAILLVIDIQGKLARLMHKKDELFRNASKLIQTATFLDIPVIVTEQAPDKIGKTIPEITKFLDKIQPITKSSFSCCGENRFLRELEALKRKQIIVIGIEAHVCVYQTASELLNKDFQVQVVADAVSSRTESNKYFGLDRIKSIGVGMTSTEMIICELLRTCEHPRFKEIVNLIK